MDRKEFLSVLGLGAAVVACAHCFEGCMPQDVTTAPTNVDFTLDLTATAYKGLTTKGGYIYKDGIIVAFIKNGTYIAVSSACTHAGAAVIYDVNSNEFYCPSHGSNFAVDGSVVNGPASDPLARYHTSLNGTSLRVYS
jgi:cytochrome b6-f complex iron-sulfur subunit